MKCEVFTNSIEKIKMNMSKKHIVIIILSIFSFYSCKKTVVLNLNNANPQIVIQGEVTDTVGVYTIHINQSVGFYADNNFPPVSGAVVKITDSINGNHLVIPLTETSPGIYSSQVASNGIYGHTYYLYVSVNGQTYRASSIMPMPVTLDSVKFSITSGFGQKRLNAVVNFQDPAGIKNYYQFIEYINGKQFTKNIFLFDDRLSDGKYITSTLFTDSTYFKTGDLLKVRMNCIDENIYNYLFQLAQSSGGGTFNTTASPANPASNISNGALGYFSAEATQSIDVYVPKY
jgi:hypothetical protein